jgi:hypothetical protein
VRSPREQHFHPELSRQINVAGKRRVAGHFGARVETSKGLSELGHGNSRSQYSEFSIQNVIASRKAAKQSPRNAKHLNV